jgi:uncharacterized integral membrane protein
MTVLTWAIRLTIFVFLVVFAAQNTDPVSLRLLPGATWQAPVVIALLAFFVGGVSLGALSLLGVVFRQRREISRLKREVVQRPVLLAPQVPPDA